MQNNFSRYFNSLVLFFGVTVTPAWAVLPLEFTSVPKVTNMALGQKQALQYTIRNQVKTQVLPLNIRLLNRGDAQSNSAVKFTTTCGATLAPNATCSITVALDGVGAGKINRLLSIDYNGRAPLISPIRLSVSKAQYTVLVYIIGSNLEDEDGQATFNINQMAMVGSSEKMNIILETGGADKEGWKHVLRKIVYPGSVSVLEDLGIPEPTPPGMGDPQMIEEFVQWGVNSYPANKYILIFWDHGGGPNGGFGDDDNIASLKDVVHAVQGAVANTGKTFELIGFDTCLLGTVEVASGLAPYANYFVASEDIEPGSGWQYNTFLHYMKTHLSATGLDIGKVIVDGFTEQNQGKSTTLSVIDNQEIPALLNAVKNFGEKLHAFLNVGNVVDRWKEIAFPRIKSPDYSTSMWDKKSTDVVDMYMFALNIKNGIKNDQDVKLAAQNLMDATNNAVKYLKNSPNRDNSSWGLSIYFPSIMNQYKTSYPDNVTPFFPSEYTDLVSAYHAVYTNNKASLVAQFTNIGFLGDVYNADITGSYYEVFAGVGYNDCGGSVGPCIMSIQRDVDKTSVSGKVSFDSAAQANTWPLINGVPVLLIPDDEDVFLVPVAGGYLSILKTGDQYNVQGFQNTAGSVNTAGKLERIADGRVFSLNALRITGSPSAPTWQFAAAMDRKITAPFQVAFGPLPNDANFNAFRFISEDLTGALSYSDEAVYPPAG